jgi:hypothetical protein
VTTKNFSNSVSRFSSVALRFLREVPQTPHIFSNPRLPSKFGTLAFVYLTSTSQDELDQLSSFNTNFSFWVCDNSATGHIFKDKSLFTTDLVPSIYEIGSVTGTSNPSFMGTITLRLMDDEGEKHSFILNNVNYLSDLPVNSLSLHRLAELYPDSAGYPDKTGTGIRSGFDSHTMFWDQEKYKKTFCTASLGLPKCLFNSGYLKLELFSTTVSKYYNNTINWAFASKEKLDNALDDVNKNGNPIPITQDNAIVYTSNVKVLIDLPLNLTILISFFDGMKLRYNDGSGTRDIVTFFGADFVDDMQIKCNIKLLNNSTILVDPETLNFLENPDIASIPQTSEDYCQEIMSVDPSEVEHLLQPQSLSPLQEEMMSHHYR